MDSRIREIEMRLAKAKEGLTDGGREEYLKQLYLLDAEIKAVIKDNGILPHAYSPPRESRRSRSRIAPMLQLGMSFGGVVLAAAVTFTVFQLANVDANPDLQKIGTAPAAQVELTVLSEPEPETSLEPETGAELLVAENLVLKDNFALDEAAEPTPAVTATTTPAVIKAAVVTGVPVGISISA